MSDYETLGQTGTTHMALDDRRKVSEELLSHFRVVYGGENARQVVLVRKVAALESRLEQAERGILGMVPKQMAALYADADKQMKRTDGHSFVTMLKTRCRYCGRSPAQKGRCPDWFLTFLDCLTEAAIKNAASKVSK